MLGLMLQELPAHSGQTENNTEGRKQWFSGTGQFAVVFWPLVEWKQIKRVFWVPKPIAWRKLPSFSTRRGTQTKPGSLAELRRHTGRFEQLEFAGQTTEEEGAGQSSRGLWRVFWSLLYSAHFCMHKKKLTEENNTKHQNQQAKHS